MAQNPCELSDALDHLNDLCYFTEKSTPSLSEQNQCQQIKVLLEKAKTGCDAHNLRTGLRLFDAKYPDVLSSDTTHTTAPVSTSTLKR